MRKNGIAAAFANNKAFIAYLMAGDPSLEKTREYILTIAGAGADIIEIGIPFSDPVAEGETIQKAGLRALASKTRPVRIFEMIASLKGEISAPLLLMTYINPVFNYGYDKFFAECAECGVDGVIIPDLPFEEHGEILTFCEKYGTVLISLIAPLSGDRIGMIAEKAKGYIYLVSSMGVTGVRNEITTDIVSMMREIKKYTCVPVAVGFGVQSPEQAASLSKSADGVITGSAIVNIISEYGDNATPALEKYVRSMKSAVMNP
ncbi:MAG: tryptophan synthase subunit alpha [Clostridiales Family XIII bacterium]|jgi:tryptophan synthase alpha chain|nr:tryptophan synthase subunit alpha [Clostridiales Family XIII bacterium]